MRKRGRKSAASLAIVAPLSVELIIGELVESYGAYIDPPSRAVQ